MKNNFLFAHKYKKIGWFILIPSVILGAIYLFTEFSPSFLDFKVPVLNTSDFPIAPPSDKWITMTNNNFMNEIIGIFLLIGAVFVAFSKEETEDEFISEIRLKSLVWAVYFNSALLLFSILFIYDF